MTDNERYFLEQIAKTARWYNFKITLSVNSVPEVTLDGFIDEGELDMIAIDTHEQTPHWNCRCGGVSISNIGLDIKRVIQNDPATIILWGDGTKTVVKAHREPFDPEKGFAMAVCKKLLGKDYKKTFREHTTGREMK